jgi:ABC-type nickel/cobalt efflux system permease component RcnA
MILNLAGRPLLFATIIVVLCGAAFAALARPGSASAHPLGNFTVNHYTRIEIYSDVVRLHYTLDMAEIPTFQENSAADADGNAGVSPSEAQSFAELKTRELAKNLSLTFDGTPVDLILAGSSASFPEGQGGLLTTRLAAVFEAPTPRGEVALTYEDTNYGDRLGWREIVVRDDTGAGLAGDYPTEDVSHALTQYPGGLLSSPLDVSRVSLVFDAGTAVAAPPLEGLALAAAPTDRAGAGFASLISSHDVTLSAVFLALLAAFAFGALHAVEPGHGKTLVAAYFIGVKGTVRQALALGLIVATTHTVGVLAIGLIAIFASQRLLPEHLYPWLSLASGLMVMALGLRLVLARGGAGLLHRLSHLPFLGHHHHRSERPATSEGIPPWRALIGIGLADGLTPSPSALVVLLAAVSLHRIGLGIALIISFSIGLAVVLASISVGLLGLKQVMDSVSRRARSLNVPYVSQMAGALSGGGIVMRALPLTGAIALLAVGLVLTLRALGQTDMAL